MKKKDRKTSKTSVVVPSTPVSAWMVGLGWSLLAWIVFVVFKFDAKFPSSIEPVFQFFSQFSQASIGPFAVACTGYLKSIALYFLFLLTVFSWGRISLPNAIAESMPYMGRVVTSFLFGSLELSLLIFAIGLLGFLQKTILLALVILLAIVGSFLIRIPLSSFFQKVKSAHYFELIDSPVKILLLFFCGFAVMMSFVPELFYDSLVYHLGLPQMYINEGRILDTPHVYFSRAPMMLHMLYVLAIGIDGSSLAKLMNWSFLMAGVGAAFLLCDTLGWKKMAPWAALIFMSMPVVQLNVWSTAVDAAMGGFAMMVVFGLLKWHQIPERRCVWSVFVGVMAGSVFALKYPGVLVVILTAIMLAYLSFRKVTMKEFLLYGVYFSIPAIIVVSPWLIRNQIWTGNPVYPILSSIIESRNMNQAKMDYEKGATLAGKPSSIWEFLRYPWYQTMLELSNFNFIGPMTLALLPLGFFVRYKGSPFSTIVIIFIFLYFFMELLSVGQIRYMLAGFFVVSVIISVGLGELSQAMPICGFFLKTAFIGLSLYNAVWIILCAQGMYKPVPLLLGNQSRAEYSSIMHDGLNLCPWNVMDADLRKLPDSSRIYILGNEQVFGFPKRFWYSSIHDDTPLVLWANAAKDGEDLYLNLKSQGFTHILINLPESVRLKNYGLYTWTKVGKKNFIELVNHHFALVNVKQIDRYPNSLFLFELKDNVPPELKFAEFMNYIGPILRLYPDKV